MMTQILDMHLIYFLENSKKVDIIPIIQVKKSEQSK